jgi:DNA-binding transcriptional ArsR family regulator
LPVSRPAVSQHLRVLRSAGLVSYRAAGTRRLYRLDPAGLAILRRELESYWDDVLAAFAAEAERARGQVKQARTATPGPSATAQEAEQEERP